MHEVEYVELTGLPRLAAWLGASSLVVRSVWALVLSAGCEQLDFLERSELRELAWALIAPAAGRPTASDEPDWRTATSLYAPT